MIAQACRRQTGAWSLATYIILSDVILSKRHRLLPTKSDAALCRQIKADQKTMARGLHMSVLPISLLVIT